jgi:hypothetical protein
MSVILIIDEDLRELQIDKEMGIFLRKSWLIRRCEFVYVRQAGLIRRWEFIYVRLG